MADTNRLNINASTLAFWFFALSIALLPVGLGGNRPVPFGLAAAGLGASAFFLLRDASCWRGLVFFPRLRVALALLGLVLAWAGMQISPFVPSAWEHPVWREAAAALGRPLKGSISLSPEDGLYGLTRLAAAIACGLLAYILAQDPRRARRLLTVLWCAAAAVCAYGLTAFLAGNTTILWFEKWAYPGDLTATFVNGNHFAIFAGTGFITGAALLVQSWREEVEPRRRQDLQKALRGWLVRKACPRGLVLALMLVCILLSHSRAGLVLTLAGFCAWLFFLQLYLKAWRRAAVIAVFSCLALILLALAAMHYSGNFAALFQDYSARDRMTVYGIMLEALAANPWLGHGLGGFQAVFRLYQPGMIMEFDHGHSDLLESLFDLGLPAGLLLWAAVLLLLGGLVRGMLRRRRDGLYPTLALAVSLAVLGHASVDFSLQCPAVLFTWTTILGVGLAQSWRDSEKKGSEGSQGS